MSACVSSLAFFLGGRGVPFVCGLCPSRRPLPVKPSFRRMMATLLPGVDSPAAAWDGETMETGSTSDADVPAIPPSRCAAMWNRRRPGFEGG
jgi:hypothetical protein